MKVLHVFKTYLPDSFTGIERCIWEIAESTHLLGVESRVLTLSARPSVTPLPVGNHWVHQARQDLYLASTGLSLSAFRLFPQLARQADLVHFHFPWPLMDLLQLASRVDRPYLVTYHSDIVRQRLLLAAYKPLMSRFLNRAARLVATSPNYLASSRVLQRYAAKTSVIAIGLGALQPFDPALVAGWQRRFPEGFFLFVGALRYYKGLPVLVEAARRSGLPVVVVGEGEMGRSLATTLPPNVALVGAVSEADKAALLEACTAFVLPSQLRSEAFGIALLEAARAGRPLLSCEIGTGTSYVNADGETGFVTAPADPEALAAAMRCLWDNRSLREGMGVAAAQRFASLFTAERMGQAYRRLYDEVAGAPDANRHD